MANPQPPRPRTRQSSTRHLFVRRERDPYAITAPEDPAYWRRRGRRSTRGAPNSYSDLAEARRAQDYAAEGEV